MESTEIIFSIIAIAICVGASAFFAGAETAVTGISRARLFSLIQDGNARARTFGHDLNKKVRALGLKMALSSKAKAGSLTVIDNLDVKDGKTKELVANLAKLLSVAQEGRGLISICAAGGQGVTAIIEG